MEFSNDKLMGRIPRAEAARVHHILVVGQREHEANNVALRIHGKGPQGVKPRAEVVAEILRATRLHPQPASSRKLRRPDIAAED